MTGWKYFNTPFSEPNTVVFRVLGDGAIESCLATRHDVQEWIAQGNTPEPADE